MKRITLNALYLIFFLGVLQSCIKDNGNYEYNYGNEVTVRFATYSYPAFLNDTISAYPQRTFANAEKDSSDYEHYWYINGEVYSEQPILKFASSMNGTFNAMYYMKDKESGIMFPAASGININVTSPFQTGWGILYEKNNESELAHVRITGGQYFPYTDLYKTYNDGASLGSQPVRLKDYYLTDGRGLMVLQNGGQGPVELNAYNFKKVNVVSETFTTSAPANFKPFDLAFYSTTNMLINQDGKLYTRAWKGSVLAYMVPWISTPYYIAGDSKIKHIWEIYSGSTNIGIMYDELNKRLLKIATYANNSNNLGIPVTALTMPTSYPADYVSLHNFGTSEYIWGGTFADNSSSIEGMVILRDPNDHKPYIQTFSYDYYDVLIPKKRAVIEDNNTFIPDSKFATLKARNYLVYTGGLDNKSIYYYDIQAGTPITKYVETESPITSLRAADDGQSIAVGLSNGTFLIYSMADNVITSGTPSESYKLTGLGKVVDITIKSGRNN